MSQPNLLWSIIDHGSDLLKNRFSLSLTPREQMKFEEEFKYLIVTSSLFNDTLKPATTTMTDSLDYAQKTHYPNSSSACENKRDNLSTRDPTLQNILITSIINVIISTFILTKFNTISTILLLFPLYTILCYFTYRYQKHNQIRKIHASAIQSLQNIIFISQESDQLLYRLFSLAHDQQEGNEEESHEEGLAKEADKLSKSLSTMLLAHLQSYMGMVKSLEPLVDKHNLARFRDMYNIKEKMPAQLTLNSPNDANSTFRIEDIDLMNTMITWKRREYLLYLLALEVMSTENLGLEKQQQGQATPITNTTYYSQSWIKAIEANRQLVDEYSSFNTSLLQLLDENMSSVSSEDDNSSLQSSSVVNDLDIQKRRSKADSLTSKTLSNIDDMTMNSRSDGRALALMHRISAIEKLMEDMQASLFLCKQDTRLVSAYTNNSNRRISTSSQYHLAERLQKRFEQMDRELENLSHQWEESKLSLNYLLSFTSSSASLSEDESSSKRDPILPSPPASPSVYLFNHQNKSLSADICNSVSTATPSTSFFRTTTPFQSVGLHRSHTYSGGRPSSLHQHRKLQHIRFGHMPPPSINDTTSTKVQELKKDTASTSNTMEPNSTLMK